MMTHAYDSIYHDRAAKVMGSMLHAAVIDQNMDGDDFLRQFIQSKIAEEFESGNPMYVAGKSGAELFMDVQTRVSGDTTKMIFVEHYERSDAYWAGWVLAYYQWYSGRTFRDILEQISFAELIRLYPTLHETDIRKCCDTLDIYLASASSKLKQIRKGCCLTQEELAEFSSVSLNTIRAYERGSKDINKAQADILLRLSKGLRCEIQDLLNG